MAAIYFRGSVFSASIYRHAHWRYQKFPEGMLSFFASDVLVGSVINRLLGWMDGVLLALSLKFLLWQEFLLHGRDFCPIGRKKKKNR